MNAELRTAIEEWRKAHKMLQEMTEIPYAEGDSQMLDSTIEIYKSAKERLLVVALWVDLDSDSDFAISRG